MRSKLAVGCAVIVVMSFGCNQADDEPSASIAALERGEFVVRGNVVDSKEGVEPGGGFPGDLEDVEDFGGLAVRPVNPGDADGLEECETVQDAYVMYYTEETLFDPPSTDASAGFPKSIVGQTVTAEGTIHEAAVDADDEASPDAGATEGCVLIAERVEVEELTEDNLGDEPADDDAGASPGVDASPEAEETATPTDGEFPDYEDTDPIFEGTPQPDPRQEGEETPAP